MEQPLLRVEVPQSQSYQLCIYAICVYKLIIFYIYAPIYYWSVLAVDRRSCTK